MEKNQVFDLNQTNPALFPLKILWGGRPIRPPPPRNFLNKLDILMKLGRHMYWIMNKIPP